MPDMQVHSRSRQAAISIVVTRADGRVEDLGVVSYYHRNPLRRLWFRLRKRLGRRIDEAQLFARKER